MVIFFDYYHTYLFLLWWWLLLMFLLSSSDACRKPVKNGCSLLIYLNFLAGARNVRNGYHASTFSQEFVWWKVKYRLVALRRLWTAEAEPVRMVHENQELSSGKTADNRRNNFDLLATTNQKGISSLENMVTVPLRACRCRIKYWKLSNRKPRKNSNFSQR